jgi:hypothetical protein
MADVREGRARAEAGRTPGLEDGLQAGADKALPRPYIAE